MEAGEVEQREPESRNHGIHREKVDQIESARHHNLSALKRSASLSTKVVTKLIRLPGTHHQVTMAKSRFEYVRNFELPDPLVPNTFSVVRIDGRGFHK